MTTILETEKAHPLTLAREACGLSFNQLGAEIEFPGGSIWRIERGFNVPRRELARALHDYFDGALPIGAIYDGERWLDETPANERKRILAGLAALGG